MPRGVYAGLGIVSDPELHIEFLDGHKHAYRVPHQVYTAFEHAASKGEFVHRVLLGKGWTPQNRQSRYPNWPI